MKLSCSKKIFRGWCLVLLIFALPKSANALQPNLAGFGFFDGNGALDRDVSSYKLLLKDLTEILVASPSDPAITVGSLGIQLDAGVGAAFVSNSSVVWQKGTVNPDPMIPILDLSMRKGLPWAFEMAGRVTYPIASGIWALGLELKGAPIEGMDGIPDVSVGVGASTAVGIDSLSILALHGRIVMSQGFGVGKSVRLTPFGGYQFIAVHGMTRVLGILDGSGELHQFLLPTTDQTVHRGFAGIHVAIGPALVSVSASSSNRVRTARLQVGLLY
jgi:hypothetical protein